MKSKLPSDNVLPYSVSFQYLSTRIADPKLTLKDLKSGLYLNVH
jgi:hypothetical protein